MKINFNDFLTESDNYNEADAYLISQKYIKLDDKNNELLIVRANEWGFPDNLLKQDKIKYTVANYTTLLRYMLFSWIYKYKGNDYTLISIKTELSKKEPNDNITRPFTQIPSNNIIMRKLLRLLNSKAKANSTKTTNKLLLMDIIEQKSEIFTETNIIKWYLTVNELTKKADVSETRTIDFITKHNIFKNPRKSTKQEDMKGIDLWVSPTNNDIVFKEVPAQVKEPKESSFMSWVIDTWYTDKNGKRREKRPELALRINDSGVDFAKYNKWTDGDLHFTYLFIWDKTRHKIYQIKTTTINSIQNFNKTGKSKTGENEIKRNVKITMGCLDEWLPRMIKVYDINSGKNLPGYIQDILNKQDKSN